jgi:hypothetical protein
VNAGAVDEGDLPRVEHDQAGIQLRLAKRALELRGGQEIEFTSHLDPRGTGPAGGHSALKRAPAGYVWKRNVWDGLHDDLLAVCQPSKCQKSGRGADPN